jgi:starch synthase
MATYRVLFCASEVYPLIKTGGLADVAGSLPHALSKTGHDVRVVLPAYHDVMSKLKHPPKVLVETRIDQYVVRISQTTLPGTRVTVWLIDCPELFDRPGNPYHDDSGQPWPDNAQRFALFCRIIVSIAMNQCGLQWQPHVVHCNDWQTGLVPALLSTDSKRPATVFTIHNLAYQGVFDRSTFETLKLPEWLWHYERLEYHDQFSFIKGGLVFADHVNTVSPNYAREIQTPAFGHGMEGLLQHRAERLSGIINGIDTTTWNPGTDELLAQKFNRQHLKDKQVNKAALQAHYHLPQNNAVMLLALVSRLAEQKGIDLLIAILPELLKRPVQLVILGSGNKNYEQLLQSLAHKWPEHIGVALGYDESLAHLIEGGADVFLMPSRFEPCGLNQMYSQHYGTLPIVSPVGGLLDTVVDTNDTTRAAHTATGFVMPSVDEDGLLATIERAIALYQDQIAWQDVMKSAMQQDFSWVKSADAYSRLYALAIRDNPKSV